MSAASVRMYTSRGTCHNDCKKSDSEKPSAPASPASVPGLRPCCSTRALRVAGFFLGVFLMAAAGVESLGVPTNKGSDGVRGVRGVRGGCGVCGAGVAPAAASGVAGSCSCCAAATAGTLVAAAIDRTSSLTAVLRAWSAMARNTPVTAARADHDAYPSLGALRVADRRRQPCASYARTADTIRQARW